MRIVLLVAIFMIGLFADEVNTEKEEFVLGKIYNQTVSRNAYFNEIGSPNISVGTRCPKEGDCWSVLENQNGEVLKSFSTSDSVSTLAKGRYSKIAYLYYSYSYGSGKDSKTEYHLVDNKLKNYDLPSGSGTLITKERDLIGVESTGIYKNGKKILSTKMINVSAIANNPQGDIAIAVVLKATDEILVTNLTHWVNTNIVLSKHGDRSGILDVYPQDKNNVYMSVYKNVNIYNKGLMGAHVNFTDNKVEEGWIFNSAERNVGFDPNMYITQNNNLHIGTQDTTNRESVHLIITPEDYAALGTKTPKHIEGFEEESIIDLLVGVGASQVNWIASSSIDDPTKDSKIEYGEVKYDIGKSLYKSLYFEGRFASTNISVGYLQNEAENIGGLTKKASQILNFLVDFDGLISKSSTLRLKATKGKINGVATYIEHNSGGGSTITRGNQVEEFESELLNYGAYLMLERGLYFGVEYTDYITPSAIGFSDDTKRVVAHGMDTNFETSYYSAVFGYDEISYAKRYEVDLSRFYIQALGGIGWADYTLSSNAENWVKKNLAGKSINYTGSLVYEGEIEIGYIFQQRFKAARGLGYSLTASYKARGAYTATGQDPTGDGKIESNELELEMSRYDIWHGPYVSANFIF